MCLLNFRKSPQLIGGKSFSQQAHWLKKGPLRLPVQTFWDFNRDKQNLLNRCRVILSVNVFSCSQLRKCQNFNSGVLFILKMAFEVQLIDSLDMLIFHFLLSKNDDSFNLVWLILIVCKSNFETNCMKLHKISGKFSFIYSILKLLQ